MNKGHKVAPHSPEHKAKIGAGVARAWRKKTGKFSRSRRQAISNAMQIVYVKKAAMVEEIKRQASLQVVFEKEKQLSIADNLLGQIIDCSADLEWDRKSIQHRMLIRIVKDIERYQRKYGTMATKPPAPGIP